MSISLNKLVYDVLNIAASGATSQDFRITEKQVIHWVNEVRSQLIVQALQKRQDISDTWVQTIPKVALELADKSEATDIPIGCYLLKSTLQLPDTIENWDDNTILSVTGLDNTPIGKSNLFRARYKTYSKYSGKQAAWYIRNNYLYVVNTDNTLGIVTVVGLFEDPLELNRFLTATGDVELTRDTPYPVSLKMASAITDIIINTKVLPLLKNPRDISNDSQDSGAIIKESTNKAV